jgi:hypothetical protein
MLENIVLPTRVGHAEWGDNRAFGHSVAEELAGKERYVGLLSLAVAGRRLTASECAVLDDLAVVMTVADPRIWPLKLVRVVASHGGCLAAFAAGELCLDEAFVGHYTTGEAARMLFDTQHTLGDRCLDPGAVTEHVRALLAQGKRLLGIGVPFRPVDERVVMLIERVRARGRADLPFWKLFLLFQTALERVKKLRPNIGLGAAALCLDLGFTPRECAILVASLGSTDFLANAVEGSLQAPAVLRELPNSAIVYRGCEPRTSPRFRSGQRLRRDDVAG